MAAAGIATLVLSCGEGAVEPAPPPTLVATTVAVSPASATLTALGETARFTAEVRDQNGQVMAGAAVAWTSSDASVAAVDASGEVTSAANGSVTITATAGSVSGTAAVTVAQKVNAVAVSPPADTLVALGDTVRLIAEATDANGHGVSGAEYSWSSSDTLVARVDDSGLVESVAEGEAAVTATASEVTGESELTVVSPLPTTVAVSPDTVRFTALKQTVQLTAEVREQAGRVMVEAFVSWSSEDTLVAVVDSVGLVTAVGGGTTTVTATVGEVSAAIVVTVMQASGSVVVSPAEGVIALGDTLRLAAEAFDENGHRVEGAAFSWSSSDAGVARVDESGLVEAVAEGTARITATAGDASGVVEVTVENPDRAALVSLYNATDGPNWVNNDNWLTDAPLGEWYGVQTDEPGRVVELRLGCELWDDEKNECPAPGLKGGIPAELGKLSELEYLDFGYNHHLTGPIPPELGNLEKLWYLDLGYNRLTGPIPLELSRLTNLSRLYLRRNRLSGPVPAWLGGLSRLWYLDLDVNQLTGPIPAELGDLAELRTLNLCCNGLVDPLPPELANLKKLTGLFLQGNPFRGPIPPWLGELSSLEVLDMFFSDLTGPIPPELGKLSSLRYLFLAENDLSGPVPPEIGGLTSLRTLSLYANLDLFGPLPQAITALDSLRTLSIDYTSLCAPRTQSFRNWLSGLDTFSGEECGLAISSHREVLKAVYESTNGDGWRVATNWLTDVPLDKWYGISADSADMVTAIVLPDNGLAGTLPVEASGLATLKELLLNGNAALGGELPIEITHLTELAAVRLDGTALCAPPHVQFRTWLGSLDDASVPECEDDHGNDASAATAISLGQRVEGELESWKDEDWFRVDVGGRGTISVTAEGDIAVYGELYHDNGSLVGYDGSPGNFRISQNLTPGTYYVRVVGSMAETRGSYALATSFEPRPPGVAAYLTQAVQSHDFGVPLVAGENALLRVFVMADIGIAASMPPVRARFYRGNQEVHSVMIDGSSVPVPHTMAERDLEATANAVVPGSVMTPGTEMVIEVDPDGTLDQSLGIAGRIPEEGRMTLDIRSMPDLDVTAVPFLWTEDPDSSGFKVAAELTADHELFYETRDWLPVAGMDVSVREAVLVDYDPKEYMDRVLDDIALLHVTDGASGYYMGVPPWIESGLLGIALIGSKVSVSRLDGHTIAHEFGHNLSLRHTPCGNPAGVDGQYPHVGGKIGAWGYDFLNGALVDPDVYTDLLTYCESNDWISDYSFTKAAEYRTETQATMASQGTGRVLVVRGGVAGGQLRLEPAFVLDAPPSLPDDSGPYRLVGSDAQGEELFAMGFAMAEIADAETEGDGAFTFAIPVRDAWAETLAEITVVGREGYVSLTRDDPDAASTALVLDAATGRIRAILRESPDPVAVQADARGAGPGIEVLFSRGLPDVAAWRR